LSRVEKNATVPALLIEGVTLKRPNGPPESAMVLVAFGTAPVPVKIPCDPLSRVDQNATVPAALIDGALNLLKAPEVSAMVVVAFGTAPVPAKMPSPPASRRE